MSPAAAPARVAYDVEAVRRDFPILSEKVRGKPLVYLDSAATTQKPRAVLDALVRYYESENANIHRGVHHLSELATRKHDAARITVARFLNAADAREIVFTRGTTESVNLVAQTLGRTRVGQGDEVLVTTMEHHSNLVPWQMLCAEKGAKLVAAPIADDGSLVEDEFVRLIGPRTKVAAFAHVSNALGTVNPVKRLVAACRAKGVPTVVDGAQAVPHGPVDVRDLDADFYCFSGHKVYAPTGIGVLYGKAALLESLPPWQGGGDMILSVSIEKSTWNRVPFKFEAGTPDIGGAIALGAALDYVAKLGPAAIAAHEADLLAHGTAALSAIPGLRLIGTAPHKAAVLSFVLEGVHPHDIGTILDQEGIAIRTGHHCAQPVMDRLGIPATARASLGLYSTKAELDALAAGLRKVAEVFRA